VKAYLTTVATHAKGYCPSFLPSAGTFGWEPVVLGWGRTWPGFGLKLSLVYHWLRCLPDLNCLVLFTDCHDAVLLADAEAVQRRFRSFRHPLVFSAETNCAPDPQLAGHYLRSPTRYRFLNSGGFIGEGRYLLDLMERHQIWSCHSRADDQRWSTARYLEDPRSIRLDTRCEHGIHNHRTHSYPLVFHGNGGSNLRPVLRWADLDEDRYQCPVVP